MKFRFPFPQPYAITQGYAENANNYPGGHHGALDIVPQDPQNRPYPALIFPIAEGSEISIADTSTSLGKGVRERIDITNEQSLRDYLHAHNVDTGTGQVFLDVLYWHMLDVTDKDGVLDPNTPIGHAGNTGYVFTNGQPVPDNQKGIPPYPGLHTHLEMSIWNGQYLNSNLDSQGRFDPMIIFNYKEENMSQFKTQNKGGELRIVLAASSIEEWNALCKVYGVDPSHIDEQI